MDNLGEFHHAEAGPDRTKKLVAIVVAAVIVAGATFYAVESGMLSSAAKQTHSYPRGM